MNFTDHGYHEDTEPSPWRAALGDLPIDPETLNDDFADLTPRQVTALLLPYDRARQGAKRAKAEQDGGGEAIKGYLLAHPEEVVTDLEHGLEALLQWRSTGDTYAVGLMPLELLEGLAQLGVLRIDTKALEALRGHNGLADQAHEYKRPGGTTPSLIVRGIR